MSTLTIKISDALDHELAQASAREKLTKSEITRRALASYIAQRGPPQGFVSALDQAGDLVGCFEGGPKDLGSNPKHMADFGKT